MTDKIENWITQTLARVPGYKGYRDKESRRDVDKSIRDSVANALTSQVDALTHYNAGLASTRDFSSLARLETMVGQTRLLADRVRHASYGYGGIFTDNNVDANALEQLRMFDAAMLREVNGLRGAVQTLASSTPPKAGTIDAVQAEIDRLSSLFDARKSVIEIGRPNTDEATLQLLALPESVEPSPLLSLKRGDALSVMDDNYIADSVITIESPEGKSILARVEASEEGSTWLLGSSITGFRSARLVESPLAAGTYQSLLPATVAIDTPQGREDTIAARYAFRDLGDKNIEFTLAVGDSTRYFTGAVIVDKDIEVYGAA